MSEDQAPEALPTAIPPLQVQRMGKLWRIVYSEGRTLAKYNSGKPLDEGGFEDVWKDGELVEEGKIPAMMKLSEITAGATFGDPEEENIGT